MKKYIIAIALFCLSLFLIEDAYAVTTSGWAENSNTLQFPTIVAVSKCTSSTSCSGGDISVSSVNAVESVISPINYYQTDSFTTPSNGFLWIFNTPTMVEKNYLYSLTSYFCHNSSTTYQLEHIRAANNQTNVKNNSYPATIHNSAVNTVNSTPLTGFNYTKCQYISSVVSFPNGGGQYLGLKLNTSDSKTGFETFWGYELVSLGPTKGLTSSDIENVISNSNLATASSVEEVKEAQEEIKTEIQVLQEEQQQTNEKLDETNKELGKMNDNLTNNDTTGATDSAGGFFEGFTTDTFGLTSIITAPLNLIKSITSKTCTPLNLQIPFVNKNMKLPCMSTVYTNYFGSFLTIYQTITFGIISYWVCIRIFALVKDFKNPDHDEIEVMDL